MQFYFRTIQCSKYKRLENKSIRPSSHYESKCILISSYNWPEVVSSLMWKQTCQVTRSSRESPAFSRPLPLTCRIISCVIVNFIFVPEVGQLIWCALNLYEFWRATRAYFVLWFHYQPLQTTVELLCISDCCFLLSCQCHVFTVLLLVYIVQINDLISYGPNRLSVCQHIPNSVHLAAQFVAALSHLDEFLSFTLNSGSYLQASFCVKCHCVCYEPMRCTGWSLKQVTSCKIHIGTLMSLLLELYHHNVS